MEFLRAKNQEQKQQRVQQILDAAAALYAEIGYDKITFSKIAQQVNFTRINLYHYFPCKEDIFLLILEQDIAALVDDAANTFTAACGNTVTFVDKWTELMMRHQRMLALLSIVNTIMLKGASPEANERYRRRLYELFCSLREVVAVALPALPREKIMSFLDIENSYAMTLYSASLEYKTAQQIPVFADTGYGTRGFAPQYKKAMLMLFQGFLPNEK